MHIFIIVVHTSIFHHGLSVDEEDILLEGLELYGVGNWELISSLIFSKSPSGTEKYFTMVFFTIVYCPVA